MTVYSVRNAHTKQWPEHLKVSDFYICEQWHRLLWEAAFEKGTEESQALMIQMGWETRLAEESGNRQEQKHISSCSTFWLKCGIVG